LMPARATSTTTSPSPASGSGRSATVSTSGPPNSSIRIAFTRRSVCQSGAGDVTKLRENRRPGALADEVVGDHVRHRVDERQVRERLREVAEMGGGLGV